jgi:hypothetical protein
MSPITVRLCSGANKQLALPCANEGQCVESGRCAHVEGIFVVSASASPSPARPGAVPLALLGVAVIGHGRRRAPQRSGIAPTVSLLVDASSSPSPTRPLHPARHVHSPAFLRYLGIPDSAARLSIATEVTAATRMCPTVGSTGTPYRRCARRPLPRLIRGRCARALFDRRPPGNAAEGMLHPECEHTAGSSGTAPTPAGIADASIPATPRLGVGAPAHQCLNGPADLRRQAFPSGQVDVVVAAAAEHHHPSSEDRHPLLTNARGPSARPCSMPPLNAAPRRLLAPRESPQGK